MSRVHAFVALVMLAAAGCAVGGYDADYAKAVERHRQGLPYASAAPADPPVAGEEQAAAAGGEAPAEEAGPADL